MTRVNEAIPYLLAMYSTRPAVVIRGMFAIAAQTAQTAHVWQFSPGGVDRMGRFPGPFLV
jgi:hypothetical protein